MVKAVFLDIDGTLMDTNYLHIEAWAQAFEEVGARSPRSRIHHEVGKGSDKLIPKFVEDGKAKRVSELHSEHYAKLQERGHPLPGANELISSLVEGATRSGWPPAPSPRNWSTTCRNSGQRVRSPESSLRTKPRSPNRPRHLRARPGAGGVSPEDAVVVGDSIWDIAAAKEAGVRAAAVMTGGAFSRAELEEAGAYAVYEDCHELLNDDSPEKSNPTDS